MSRETGATAGRAVTLERETSRFDLGWVEQTGIGGYKCVATFDAALKPAGAAWIKVDADGTIGKDIVR